MDLSEFLEWINNELNGYDNVSADDVPPYRKLTGNARAFDPYRGWQPILFTKAGNQELFSTARIRQAVGPLEEMLARHADGGSFIISYPPKIKVCLVETLEFATDVHIQISYGEVWAIVDAVRNVILNWSLELEKSGILGDGLTFSENEKRQAAPVSHQFFANNIGVVGNISDQSQVSNVQSAHVQQIDYDKLTELVRQIKTAAPVMPEDRRDALVEAVDTLEQELSKRNRDSSKIRGVLASIRTICEGAAGNVVAQGILSLISSL